MVENKANTSKRTGDVLFITESGNITTDASTGYYYRALLDGYVESNISDKVKLICGSFWCVSETGAQNLFNKKYKVHAPVRNIKLSSTTKRPDGSIRERIKLVFAGEYEAYDWSSSIKAMFDREEPSYDHTTSIHAFEAGTNTQEESAGIANHYAKIESDYNFLEKKYEEAINTLSPPEPILPNFYNFVLKDQNHRIKRRLSLRERINIPPSQQLDGESEFKPVSNYYNQWAKNFGDYRLENLYLHDVEVMENITFTKEEMVLLSDLYKHKESFPMFTTTEFTTANDSVFGDTLEKTTFSSKLNQYGYNRNIQHKNIDIVEVLSTKSNSGELSGVKIIPGTKKFLDVKEFFEKYTPGTTESTEFFFNENIRPEERYKAYYNLMSIIAQGKMDRMSKDYTRTYKEILDGKKSYTETVTYVLSKYDESGNHIQSQRFPNTSDVDVIKFVDTQVKYDKRYTYKIKCQNIIFGTEYKIVGYSNTGLEYNITVDSKPSIKIVEFDLFEKPVLVSDNPPIAPEVLPIPFRNINNKIKLLMNSGIGRYSIEPITFTDEEAGKIEKYKIAQDIPSFINKIKYETDDPVTKFCVYKTEKKPTSYMDFIEYGEEMTVLTNNASSASIVDKIEPNKKFYYFVRSEDYHGNKSFPSVVYEVTIVDDTGSIYPIIRTYEFEKPVTKQPTMGVKRFMNIKPSRENLFVDSESMGILDSDRGGPIPGDVVALGINSESMWFKKFKIRLTSKSTGKKIDFNFKMKYKTKETTEEES